VLRCRYFERRERRDSNATSGVSAAFILVNSIARLAGKFDS
jgi:hypothetical protein